MDRAEYEASVCQRLHQAKHVLFREVWFADGSVPHGSRCHDNVDRWVKENSGTTVLRGWVTYAEFSLTAHSVVRGADGGLFDITPLETKDPRIRAAMCFIPHLGDEQSFFSMKALGININCPQTSKEGRARMSIKATAVVKRETKVDPKKPNDKAYYASLSVLNEDGKEYGLPRYLSEFREVAVLLKREAGVTHEQLHERFAAYERGDEISFPLTLESDEAIKNLGFDPTGAADS